MSTGPAKTYPSSSAAKWGVEVKNLNQERFTVRMKKKEKKASVLLLPARIDACLPESGVPRLVPSHSELCSADLQPCIEVGVLDERGTGIEYIA